MYQRTDEIRTLTGPRGGAVGWGTALQTEMSRVWFPMVSLEIFVHIIHPANGVDLADNRNEVQEYFLELKAADAEGWQPYHLQVQIVLKAWDPQPAGACPGL